MDKKSKLERALDHSLKAYAMYQEEGDKRFRKYDEERWAKQMELEERRRREDMEHEERMMRVIERMFQRGSQYHFNPEEYNF